MNAPTEHLTIIKDMQGQPAFVVLPYVEYLTLKQQKAEATHTIPNEVAGMVLKQGFTPCRAWREYLGLTQATIAERLGISQSAYAQQENGDKLRKASRDKIAKALGLHASQLDF
jgi:DNA-binding XRE family transcriptional regulator